MSQNSVITEVQQICIWLGLPEGSWPPDHYTLLGLPPAESDIDRIEQQVHQRLTRLRCYQLSNPMLATEAMTQLAKAFDCLTTPERKKVYDAAHFPKLPPAGPGLASPRAATVLASDTAETTPIPDTKSPPVPRPPRERRTETPLSWQAACAPPPVRSTPSAGDAPGPLPMPLVTQDASQPPPVRLAPPALATPGIAPDGFPVAEPAANGLPPVIKSALDSGKIAPTYFSAAALQYLGTRRDLFERLLLTRRLLRAWQRAGKYLNKPERRLTKPVEEAELTRLLLAIDDLLEEAPELLGQPGQPGYHVLALVSQEPVAEHFKSLEKSQREALARDYCAGRVLLEEYRELLMEEVKCHRKLTCWQRYRRACDAALTAHLAWVVVGLGLIAAAALAGAWFW
jgi:hypothetical protein